MTARLSVADLQRRVGSMLGLVALLLLPVLSVTTARAAPYKASFDSECCYGETIESGAIEPEYFILTNVGEETWGAAGGPSINLGTDEPENRYSEFEAPDWPAPGRPVKGVTHPVPPDSSYKFVFDVKAPVVSKPTEFVEHFGLLAELDVWMDANSGLGPDLYLPFTVVPAQPPTVAITSSPSLVSPGEPIVVNAQATANASVNHVTIWLAGQQVSSGPTRNPEIASDEQTTWNASATFSTSGLGSGPETIVATAYDDAGLSSTATATVQIQAPPTAPPPTSPTISAPLSTPAVGPIRMYFAGSTVPHRSNQLRLKRVVIIGTRKGEQVSASCTGCHGTSKLGPSIAKGGEVTFTPRHLVVTGRSKLVIDVTEPNIDGRYKVYAIHVNTVSATPRQEGCLLPNATKHVTC
jgi:hypothetical protein